MALPYSIDNLLQKNDVTSATEYENVTEDVTSSLSCSEDEDSFTNESQSDKTTLRRKTDKRHKSEACEEVRLRVNSRERQRMHDLNSALESLRKTLPYSQGPSVKKISKMATLIYARNYIVTLNRSLEEMRKLVTEVTMKQTTNRLLHTPAKSSAEVFSTMTPISPVSPLTPLTPTSPYAHHVYARNDVTRIQGSPVCAPGMQFMFHRLPVFDHHVSGSVSPLCPCNFCQTSLATLPKMDVK